MQKLVEYCEDNGETNSQRKLGKTFEYITDHREQLKRLVHADKQGFFAQYQIDYLMEQLTDHSYLTSIFYANGIVGLLEHYLMSDVSEKKSYKNWIKLPNHFIRWN